MLTSRYHSLTRRDFLGGVLAVCSLGTAKLWADASARPNLVLGVISDVHVGAEAGGHGIAMDDRIEKALRWFDAQGVDAVMVPGDIAHSGLISELERFAAIWYRVFPGDRGADGRPVEKLFVTGNHDLAAFWVKGNDVWRRQNVFNHADNPQKVWKRLFNEEWQSIWCKRVKGYTFVGSQWPTPNAVPPVEAWFKRHAQELQGPRPFFYVQHNHPKGTCGNGLTSYDDGTSTRALSPFAHAVAFTGHSHQTLTDDSAVWQGAFTSINAGSLRAGANDRWCVDYDSRYPFYSNKKALNRMIPLDDREGGGGLLVQVFDDHLHIRRRSFVHDAPLGSDWIIPLPATPDTFFEPKRQTAASVGPAFPPEARLMVIRHACAPQEIAGPFLAGKPCVQVRIPHPRTLKDGSRVYDFVVALTCDGKTLLERLVAANGFNVPEAFADRVTDCLFGADEVPSSGDVRFEVTPRNAFGVPGKPCTVSLA